MSKPRVVVITGMHRSGTSLIASLIQEAGVNIGDQLIGPAKGNPRGHFEDADFNLYHARLLRRFGLNFLAQNTSALGELTPEAIQEAMSLIEQRNGREVWGWKDPRTTLFLDVWHTLLPRPCYLFIYRHPVEVVLSLFRRSESHDVEVLANPLIGLRVWQVYNESIINFYRHHPGISLLCHISGITADIESFIELASRKLDLPLCLGNASHLYHAEDLNQKVFPDQVNAVLRQIAPETVDLYEQLEAQADLPSKTHRQVMAATETLKALARLNPGEPLSETEASNRFALLLTLLEPQVLLDGKAALDTMRVEQIGLLETHLRNKDAQVESLRAHTHNLEEFITAKERNIQRLTAHSRDLEQALAARDAHIHNQEQFLTSKDEEIRSQSNRIAELKQHIRNRSKRIAELEQEIQNRSNRVTELEQEIQSQTNRIAELEQEIRSRSNRIAELEQQERDQTTRIAELEHQADGQTNRITELERQARHFRMLAEQGERIRAEYETIRSTLAFQFMARIVWPFSNRFVPASFRRWLKSVLWRVFGRKSAPPTVGQLVFWLDSDLSHPFIVSMGSLLYLAGWCYHTERKIRHLDVLVDGKPHRIVNHSIARPDVLRDQAPRIDRTGNSLLSGFWTVIPFEEISAPRQMCLSFRARLDNGEQVEASIGALELVPAMPFSNGSQMADAAPATTEPLVAICMATYNPPLDLFTSQISSIRQQTHPNWICIINDDCSAQSVFEEIERIAAQDKRFLVHRNPSRLGVYYNFEKCLTLVPEDAEYVAFCDQDDEWYPDKLTQCLAAFDDKTQLVYSDMDIVTRGGKLISHTYWVTRKNNYTSLESMLFANTVTGAASLFRASLLREVLPFPKQIGDAYHDHWVACVALTKGAIKYIDRPLHAYRQHSENAYGFHRVEQHRLVPELSRMVRWLRMPFAFRNEMKPILRSLDTGYYSYLIRLVLIAGTLRLRIRDASRRKKRILAQIASMEWSLHAPAVQGIKYKLFRRPTLGYEWYCLRSAVGHRLIDFYYRRNRLRLYRQTVSMPASTAAPADHVGSPELNVTGMVALVRQMVAPLKLAVSPSSPQRVNLIMATINFRYVFGGYIAMFNLAKHLKSMGYNVRIVIIEPCEYNPTAWKLEIAAYPGLEGLFDQVETAYRYDRSVALDVNPDDTFVATSCWAAHVAYRAAQDLEHEKFIFFAQEYEPMFFPMSSFYALSQQSYALPQFTIFSTDLLREYFRQNRLGVFRESDEYGEENSVFFRNAINSFRITEKDLAERKRRKLLFYSRPEQHASRNMFELGVLGLTEAIEAGYFDLDRWEFYGIGSIGSFKRMKLYRNADLKLLPKVSLQEYLNLLPTYDLGLSLMLTPHPSLMPIDMAAAGLIAVTNTYANKTREEWAKVSPNIIAVPPTIEGIRNGLIAALRKVDNYQERIAGSKVNWPTNWADAFSEEFTAKLEKFIEWSANSKSHS